MSTRMPTLLDTKTTADILGVTPRTLEAWRAEGRGPSFTRLGHRSIRYDLDGLVQFIRERKAS